jgi:hypothetical protein
MNPLKWLWTYIRAPKCQFSAEVSGWGAGPECHRRALPGCDFCKEHQSKLRDGDPLRSVQ